MDPFSYSFGVVVGEEGVYSANPSDPGNWTGGAVGRGACHGTKYGIAASSHPSLNIAVLTLAQAQAIYHAEYWEPLHGDALPPPLALLAFDAAVNNGLSHAVRWLQAAAGTEQDGTMGAGTLHALLTAERDIDELMTEFQAARLIYMSALPTWHTFGLGWARRLCGLPFKALPLIPSPANQTQTRNV